MEYTVRQSLDIRDQTGAHLNLERTVYHAMMDRVQVLLGTDSQVVLSFEFALSAIFEIIEKFIIALGLLYFIIYQAELLFFEDQLD